MKFRKLIVLVIILGILGIFAVAKKANMDREKTEGRKPEALYEINKDVDAGFVSKIVVCRADDAQNKIILAKNDAGNWRLASIFDLKTRKSQVEKLLQDVTGLKGEIRSESKDVLDDFSIGDAQGIHLELLGPGDKKLGTTILSAMRPGPSGNFARRKGQNAVIVTQADVLSMLEIWSKDSKPTYKTFADMQVLPLDISSVSVLRLASDKGRIVLVKSQNEKDKSDVWNFDPADPKALVDSSKVSNFLNSVGSLYGNEASDPRAGWGFAAEPWIKIEETKEGRGAAKELYLGNLDKDKKMFAVKSMPSGEVFQVAETSVTNLKKDKSAFLKSS